MNGRLMCPLLLEFNQNVFDSFVDCLQVAIRIPNCVTLISGFNGYRDKHLMTQKQASRILELLICYASVIILWSIRGGLLLDSRLRGTSMQVSHTRTWRFPRLWPKAVPLLPEGISPFSTVARPFCPFCALLSPCSPWSHDLAQFDRGTASPELGQAAGRSIQRQLGGSVVLQCSASLPGVSAVCQSAEAVTLLLPHGNVTFCGSWSRCEGCFGVQVVLVVQGIHTSALNHLNWK